MEQVANLEAFKEGFNAGYAARDEEELTVEVIEPELLTSYAV